MRGLVPYVEKGVSPASEEVQALVALHHKWLCHFWTPNRESYAGLGRLYVEHADFRKFYDPYHPKMADFLAEAMKAYAETRLA